MQNGHVRFRHFCLAATIAILATSTSLVAATFKLNLTGLNFDDQTVGTFSPARPILLTNNKKALAFALSVQGDYEAVSSGGWVASRAPGRSQPSPPTACAASLAKRLFQSNAQTSALVSL